MQTTLIFSDLDGTLLDADSYDYREALPALRLIQARGMPLIFCSSKTRAELEVWRRQLGNVHPFIVENGGGIFIPHGYFSTALSAATVEGYQRIELGLSYAEIRQRFVALRTRYGTRVRGFADMTVAQIAELTGLSTEAAELARQRDFDEPFVFDGEPDQNFLQAIVDDGLRWTQGRIFHIMGRHDKGRAVCILQALYRREYGDIVSIGLGDGLNDLPLLQAVDTPVLIRHPDGSFDARISMDGLIKTDYAGSKGWNAVLMALLNEAAGVRQTLPDLLDSLFHAALVAVDPCHAVLGAAKLEHGSLLVGTTEYPLAAFDRIVLVGAGKATARMALALEILLGEHIAAGLIVVKASHTAALGYIEQIEASHPVPDAAGVAGTQRILALVRAANERTLVICLLSGGASALLVAPVDGVTLADKQAVTTLLLKAGASIGELNAVRKHLSAVKGGRLAQAAYPAQMVTMILSDVIGDCLDVIASGPTAADSSSFADAWAVVEKYRLQPQLPANVIRYLQQGIAGQVAETVKAGDPCLGRTRNVIVGSLSQALAAARTKARQLGMAAQIITAELQGEARTAASWLAQTARVTQATLAPGERCCLLSGGETTVSVSGAGTGGRNQELALAFALEIAGEPGIYLLSAGTDGGDGPTDAAGARVDGSVALRAQQLGLSPAASLAQNDSYHFFRQFDALAGAHSHIITGPTGTNVMDIQIILLEGQPGSTGVQVHGREQGEDILAGVEGG